MRDHLGHRLRELRTRAGLTIEELSGASGVSVSAISDMERVRAPQPRKTAGLMDLDGAAPLEPDDISRRPLAASPEEAARLTAWVFLGNALAEAGRWPEALDAARFALPPAETFGEPQLLGIVHLTLGRAYAATDDTARARTELHGALALFRMQISADRWIARAEAALAALDVPASA